MSTQTGFNVNRETLFESELRFSNVIIMDLVTSEETAPQSLKDALYDIDEIKPALDEMGVKGVEDYDDTSELIYLIANEMNVCGVLAQVETPLPNDFMTKLNSDELDRHSYGYSWGRYTSTWIYAKDIQSLTEKAEKWRANVIDEAYNAACEQKSQSADNQQKGEE